MNFYLILGLGPDASTADIKRAYRRLVRRYHPGINPGDRAAEVMYQQVMEAYETLVDPGRRRQYDTAGAPQGEQGEAGQFVFAEFDFSATRHGAQASTFTELFADVLHPISAVDQMRPEIGADIHVSLTLSFAEAVQGVERQVLVTRQVLCGLCAGAGQVATIEGKCGQCQGTGHVRWARGHMVFSKDCAQCNGSGRQRRQRCGACAGQGRSVRSDTFTVRVPPGIMDGGQVRVPERGHAGWRAGRPGDLYVTVHVQPHPRFRRDGDDLVCELPVMVHEAALGARIDAPALDGTVKLRIPPGTQSGDALRLEERGVPSLSGGRGDLVFIARLVLPDTLDERSKELLREFGVLNSRKPMTES
jgi:molecular chaperone DnaJ